MVPCCRSATQTGFGVRTPWTEVHGYHRVSLGDRNGTTSIRWAPEESWRFRPNFRTESTQGFNVGGLFVDTWAKFD